MRTLDLDDVDDMEDGVREGAGPDLLTDPGWRVPPVPEDVPEGTMAWLRARVARFSSGEAHARRRALAIGALGALGVSDGPDVNAEALRDAARVRTQELLSAPGTVEVMARVARVVPAEVLAASLGLPVTADTAGLVGDVASAYHAHGETIPAADRALTRLVADCGGTWDEATAARIGLLVQAYDATAGLIGNAAYLALTGAEAGAGTGTGHAPEPPPEPSADLVTDRLDQTLRTDPPVRGTLRAPVDGGDPVRVGLVTSDGSLAFGAGAHACPGQAHARAVAAGVLDALLARGCRLVRPDLAYEPSVNLRVPAALEVVCG
ncbi:cytochrome P450 [Streptomyces chrestomyceticus]|nr:cytochrome P450 [Streptomyces chrestomyceticus]